MFFRTPDQLALAVAAMFVLLRYSHVRNARCEVCLPGTRPARKGSLVNNPRQNLAEERGGPASQLQKGSRANKLWICGVRGKRPPGVTA